MSQFASPRSIAPGVPRTGITQSLQAPGVTPDQPLSRGAQMAQEMMGVMGLTAAAANQAANFARMTQALDQQAQRFIAGQSTLQARTDLPGILGQVQNGEIVVAEGMEVADFASQYLDQLTADMTPAQADAYRRVIQPQLAAALQAKQQQDIDDARAEMLGLLAESNIVAESPAEIRANLDEARQRFPGLDETQLLASLVMPAARSAAQHGDAVRLEAALDVLGDRFPAERLKLQAEFEQGIEQRRRAIVREATDAVYGLLNDQQPYDLVLERIEQYRQDGSIDQQRASQLRAVVDQRRNAELREQMQALAESERQRVNDQVFSAAHSLMQQGRGFELQDIEYQLPDGRTERITVKDMEQAVTAIEFHHIDQAVEAEDITTEQGIARKVQFLAANNIEYQPWARAMTAGYAATVAQIAGVGDGEPQSLPPALDAGYQLYKHLSAVGGGLVERHLKDGSAARFYEVAQLYERFHGNDPQTALLMAARAIQRPAFTDDITRRSIASKVEDTIWGPGGAMRPGGRFWRIITAGRDQQARNELDIAGKVGQLARLYMETGAAPTADDAVTAASQRIRDTHTFINGWLIETSDVRMPRDIDVIANRLIDDYVDKYGAEEGIGKSDIAIIPGPSEGTFILMNMPAMQPVDNWQSDGFFTAAHLGRISDQIAAEQRQAKDREAARKQEVTRRREQFVQQQQQRRKAASDSEPSYAADRFSAGSVVHGNETADRIIFNIAEFLRSRSQPIREWAANYEPDPRDQIDRTIQRARERGQ